MDSDVKITKSLDLSDESIGFSSPVDSKSKNGKKSTKGPFYLIILIGLLLALGFFLKEEIKNLLPGSIPQPAPTPVAQTTPEPEPTAHPLIRSEWTLEVLNGTGIAGLAKKASLKLEALGYPVIKTGNADKSNYSRTEIVVRKDFSDKVNLVIADIKDVVLIASQAGELTEGTASARIILGKDWKL